MVEPAVQEIVPVEHAWRVTLDDNYVPFSDYLVHPEEVSKEQKVEDKALEDYGLDVQEDITSSN